SPLFDEFFQFFDKRSRTFRSEVPKRADLRAVRSEYRRDGKIVDSGRSPGLLHRGAVLRRHMLGIGDVDVHEFELLVHEALERSVTEYGALESVGKSFRFPAGAFVTRLVGAVRAAGLGDSGKYDEYRTPAFRGSHLGLVEGGVFDDCRAKGESALFPGCCRSESGIDLLTRSIGEPR